MTHPQNLNIQEPNDYKKILELVLKNYPLFIISIAVFVIAAFMINRYSIPIYSISSSILIKGSNARQAGGDETDFLYSNLISGNQNFQNELWILRSFPIVEKTVRNMDLTVTYYTKGRFNYYESYQGAPFKVSFLSTHPQPINLIIDIQFLSDSTFNLTAYAKKASFYSYETNEITHRREKWSFTHSGKFGELIETPDLAFIIEPHENINIIGNSVYGFKFSTISSISGGIKSRLGFTVVDRQATVIRITLTSESPAKGVDILDQLMTVYSEQNLERKNHLATITIEYIEKQLSEISDSLSITEDNLQQFLSSNQLININDQATVLTAQWMELKNQLAELNATKNYFDNMSELLRNNNFSNLALPASMGISDQVLNDLVNQLITTQAKRSNLIENDQAKNPLVQKYGIEIETLKKTISENIAAFSTTTSISIDEMNRRIRRAEAELNRLPATQRQLGNIERKYRLNDAIYNYLMEKHAEAKISKAGNLPDDVILEPAKAGASPTSPNKRRNYMVAFCLGILVPFGFIWLKYVLNNTLESQDDIEHITNSPVLGKIMHNRYKTKNVMYEFPKSNIAESIRALRTNLDFYVRGGQKKVILVTSCLENEGKSFVSLNLAMSYAQLGRRTILVDCDLRKPKIYFREGEESVEGLSSYMIDKASLEDLIIKSPHEKLDYILSGILPPNPVELLALDKTEKLIARLRNNYDIIVLDTTPLAQVTDAYLLINHSEIKVIITRARQTLKNVFSLVMKDLRQKNITNTCIVLNDNKYYRDQYGYGYGYYNKKGLFKRRTKKRKRQVVELPPK